VIEEQYKDDDDRHCNENAHDKGKAMIPSLLFTYLLLL
jgi:hypothetical protein